MIPRSTAADIDDGRRPNLMPWPGHLNRKVGETSKNVSTDPGHWVSSTGGCNSPAECRVQYCSSNATLMGIVATGGPTTKSL
jgi:hypothetical protein